MLLEISLLVGLLRFHALRLLSCFFRLLAERAIVKGRGRHVRHIEWLLNAIHLWWASLLLVRFQRLKFFVQLLVEFVLTAISHALELLLLTHLVRLSAIVGPHVVLILVELIERHWNVR